LRLDDWRNLPASCGFVIILSGDFAPQGQKSSFGARCPPSRPVLRSRVQGIKPNSYPNSTAGWPTLAFREFLRNSPREPSRRAAPACPERSRRALRAKFIENAGTVAPLPSTLPALITQRLPLSPGFLRESPLKRFSMSHHYIKD
jgi:hypothetical protein